MIEPLAWGRDVQLFHLISVNTSPVSVGHDRTQMRAPERTGHVQEYIDRDRRV